MERLLASRPVASYWHGGSPGRRVGEFLLPPSVTGTRLGLSAHAGEGERRPGMRADRVYVATQYEVAALYAALFPGEGTRGCVYRVVPVGALEPDADCDAPGLSWACERARVVSVHVLSEDEALAILSSAGGAS